MRARRRNWADVGFQCAGSYMRCFIRRRYDFFSVSIGGAKCLRWSFAQVLATKPGPVSGYRRSSSTIISGLAAVLMIASSELDNETSSRSA